ncbi:proto-oncogene Mas-like [Elgaria multicarinata webbii]|uniref:proto-oncogene Mas-like n=1 Tax=Elgaria multicarinata webbii TaxID=159646 RepID=UPI002FCCBBA7
MAEAVGLSSYTVTTIRKNYTQPGNWPKNGNIPNFLEIIVILSVPICIWGLAGNGIVFWFLCCKLKRTKIIMYFLNLAVADFIVVFYYMIAFSLFLTPVTVNMYFLRVMENVYLIGYNSGIYFLTAISATRYLTVFFPIWYQCHQPKHLSVIVFLWTLSCLMSLMVYIACYPRFLSTHRLGSLRCGASSIFAVIVNLFAFFPIMLFSALAVFIRLQKKGGESPPTGLDTTITVIVILFLIFGSSVRSVDAYAYWDQRLGAPFPFLISLLFDSIKCSANPFVYLFLGWRKRETSLEPLYKFVERALMDKGSMAEDTDAGQKQDSSHPKK